MELEILMINNKVKPDSSSQHKKKRNKQIFMYIKGTASNIFISFYKLMAVDPIERNVYAYKLVKTFSCGQFKYNKYKKDSLININNLSIKSSIYALKNGIRNVHIIIDSANIFKKLIVYNVLTTTYKNRKLHLMSLTDVLSCSYTKYKIKKEKKR